MPLSEGLEASFIAPNVWMGSRPPIGGAVARAGFRVLALCAMEWQPPADCYPDVEVLRIALNDAELGREDARAACRVAARLYERVRQGQKVLITCSQGRNRSGLITAMTLAGLTGCSGEKAIRAVRGRRNSPFGPALTNDHYVTALMRVRSPAQPSISTIGRRIQARV
jgi:hypothetical protein